MQNATSRGHGLGLCQATSDRLMKGREGREEGGGPHPLHPLPTGSQNGHPAWSSGDKGCAGQRMAEDTPATNSSPACGLSNEPPRPWAEGRRTLTTKAASRAPPPTSPQQGPASGPHQHGPVSQATVPVRVAGRAGEDQPQRGLGGAPRQRWGPRKSQADGEGCSRRQQPLPPAPRPEAGTEPWEKARPWAGGAPSLSQPSHVCLSPQA